MKRFNLSQWAITHQALVLFMILVLAAAGAYSYLSLGRAEDPSFTIKTMVVNVGWPGATASEMQTQVADKIEKKLQELPYLDRVESYSQPGVSFIQVFLIDQTPPAKVKELWYQVRKKVGDIKGDLPAGVTGPNFNDEYGDVYSAIYMLSADGLSLRRSQEPRRGHPPAAAARSRRQQGRHHRRAAAEDLHRAQPRQAGDARASPPQQIFDGVAKQNAVAVGRLGRYRGRPHQPAGHRRLLRRRRHRGGAGAGRRAQLPPGRHRHGQARLPGPAELHRARGRQAGARPRRLHAGRRQHDHARRASQDRHGRDHRRAAASASR